MSNHIFNGRTVAPITFAQLEALHRVGWFEGRRQNSAEGRGMTIAELMTLTAVMTQPAEAVADQIDAGTFEAEAAGFFAGVDVADVPILCIAIARASQAVIAQ